MGALFLIVLTSTTNEVENLTMIMKSNECSEEINDREEYTYYLRTSNMVEERLET
jgi:phage terminase large subunit